MTRKLNLKFLYVLIFFYSIYDILNSASAGNATDDRSKVYILLFAVIAVMIFFCLQNRYLPKINVLTAIVLFTIYYLIDMVIIKGTLNWTIVVHLGLSMWWILTIWLFYVIIKQNIESFLSIQNFIRFMFLLFSLGIAYGSVNIISNYSVSFARVGYIYHILAMLPLVLLERNNKLKSIYIIISIGLAIFSFKRGAIIILPCMLLAYFVFDNNVEQRKKNISRMLLMVIVLEIAWISIDRYSGGYLSSRFTRAELMDGSGRSDIWNAALNNISMRNVHQLLFGIRNVNEQPLSAGIHNEWISYLNTNGMVGLLLFSGIVFCIILQAIRLIRERSCLAGPYVALIVYILGVCWVSGFFHVHSTFYVMLFLGVTQGLMVYDEGEVCELIEGQLEEELPVNQ